MRVTSRKMRAMTFDLCRSFIQSMKFKPHATPRQYTQTLPTSRSQQMVGDRIDKVYNSARRFIINIIDDRFKYLTAELITFSINPVVRNFIITAWYI